MAHPFSDEGVAVEVLAFCTVAWADDLDRCLFADLARSSRSFAAAARVLRAGDDGCVDHSCVGCVTMAVYSTLGGGQGLAGCQTLEGSFSAVWTATIATKGSFCSVFRDLQDLHSFAPL